MASLETVITQVQAYLAGVSGIRKAPSKPPDQINLFPFAVTYPFTGRWTMAPAGSKTGLHDLVIELHVARKDLPRDYALAIAFAESIPNELFLRLKDDSKWNGTIDTFGDVTYEFLPMTYGGVETLGWRFTVENVKIQSNVIGSPLVQDLFTDAGLTALTAHTPNINAPGNAWVAEFNGGFQISASGVTADAGGFANHAGSGIDAESPDVTVVCDLLSGSPVASAAGICFRGTGGFNYYTFKWVDDGTLIRIQRQDGGETILAQAAASIAASTTYRFKVVVLGVSIKAYIDDVLKFNILDSTFNGNRHGLYQHTGKSTLWDNFEIQD